MGIRRWMTGFVWAVAAASLISCQKTAGVPLAESPGTEVLRTETEEVLESREIDCFEGVKFGMSGITAFTEEAESPGETEIILETEISSEENGAEDSAEGESAAETTLSGEEDRKEPSGEAPVSEETPSAGTASEPEQSRAAALKASAGVSQMILVEASGTQAAVTMHQKNEAGLWEEIYRTSGYVGWDGVGNTTEYNMAAPAGVYTLGPIFGSDPDPGCPRGYIQVDDSYYWVDDVDSVYYNQMISTRTEGIDESAFNSAERLWMEPVAYAYVAAINYNTDRVPGAGSAIFLHVSEGKPTEGCVAVPREAMVFILTHLASDTRIVIGNSSGAFALDQY